jgi:hypothetical protein
MGFLVLLACFFALIAYFRISISECPAGIGNKLGFLLQNSYYIPKESNICVFETTMQGEGSGGGWMYGEDDKYYYGVNVDEIPCASEFAPMYYNFKKGAGISKFRQT